MSGPENTAIGDLLVINEFFSNKSLLLNFHKTNLVSFHTKQNINKQTQIIQINSSKSF